MGPTLKNLNNLLSLPFGCGEQNLANFAPNVYVLKYLKGTRQMSEETRIKAIRYLQLGQSDVTNNMTSNENKNHLFYIYRLPASVDLQTPGRFVQRFREQRFQR